MERRVSAVMFCDTACLLLAFCHFVVGESLKPIIDNNSLLSYNRSIPRIFQDILIPVLHKKGRKKQIVMDGIIRNGRSKRGIILIDEDFDVPAEPGIKHGWSSGELEKGERFTHIDKDIFTIEGSGSFASSEATEATYSASQTKTRTPKVPPTTEISLFSTAKAWAANIEGSGDDIFIESTLTTFTESTLDYHTIQNLCINFTCDDSNIYIYPEHVTKVPEGSNLLLSCSATNSSTLYWYKDNGTDFSFLHRAHKHYELFYNISYSKAHHSGKYICLRIKEKSCCQKEVHITVYVVPAYQYHLLIICIITVICLIACTVLGIWRTITIKKYAKQFVNKHNQMPPLI